MHDVMRRYTGHAGMIGPGTDLPVAWRAGDLISQHVDLGAPRAPLGHSIGAAEQHHRRSADGRGQMCGARIGANEQFSLADQGGRFQ